MDTVSTVPLFWSRPVTSRLPPEDGFEELCPAVIEAALASAKHLTLIQNSELK